MSHWYVYRGDEPPLGPWTTETVAENILSGTLAPDTWVAAPAGSKWLRARDVPVIAALVDGSPTTRARGGAAIAQAPDTFRTPPPLPPPVGSPIIEVITVPKADPPDTRSAYYGGGDTLESPGNERRRS